MFWNAVVISFVYEWFQDKRHKMQSCVMKEQQGLFLQNIRNPKVSANFSAKILFDMRMPGDCGFFMIKIINIKTVSATFPDQRTFIIFQITDEFGPLHREILKTCVIGFFVFDRLVIL